MSDRVMVMYGGRKCEEGCAEDVFAHPLHPYTRGLIASYPDPELTQERLPTIPGSVPSLWDLPAGCPFRNRCPYASTRCEEEPPPEEQVSRQHSVLCHEWKKVSAHG